MRFTLLHIFLFAFAQLFAQSKKHLYNDTTIKIEYHTKNGLMDGKYISHYINGQKKAEGHFKNNLREGKWMIWDSTGKITVEHTTSVEIPVRNPAFYFEYPFLKQQDVLTEKRIWRTIKKENNRLLFNNVNLFDSLYIQIQKDSLPVFTDEEFITLRKKESIEKDFGSEKYEIIGYKLKEDWFFDKKINRCETRILGIYPVLKPRASENGENIGLGWIYYPMVRKYFAQETVSEKDSPIKTLDDIFFFRHFYGRIYKETNIYDRPIAAYEKTEQGADKESERIDLSMIEMEHNVWINQKKQ